MSIPSGWAVLLVTVHKLAVSAPRCCALCTIATSTLGRLSPGWRIRHG